MTTDRPVHPLDQPDYLDGYLSAVFDDDDLPDGAWFEMCKGMIAEHWNIDIDDAHEAFLQYLEWKSEQPGSNVTKTPSKAETQGHGHEPDGTPQFVDPPKEQDMPISYGDVQDPKDVPKTTFPRIFYPLKIHVTPEVDELLKSKEAKHYLSEIKRASVKLLAMFERECKGNAIKGALDTNDYLSRLEAFLDKNVPTWRSEIDEFQSDDNRDSG